MMSDGVVSIGEGKSGSESSPTHKRRGSNFGLGVTSAAPAPGVRVKRSPQGSVTGGSSTKGSERDDMEEVSNEEGELCSSNSFPLPKISTKRDRMQRQ